MPRINGVVNLGPAGVPVWRVFPFDYTMQADLAVGLDVYKPQKGELFITALMLNETVWNGITPSGDVAPSPSPFGYFAGVLGPMDMTAIGAPLAGTRSGLSVADISPLTFIIGIAEADVTGPLPQTVPISYPTGSGVPIFPDSPTPARFDGNATLQVRVSQDGTNSSPPPGATQGSSKLYFCTVVPLAVGSSFVPF